MPMEARQPKVFSAQAAGIGWDEFSPWKIEVSDDDVVYIGDFTAKAVLGFDQTIGTNSLRLFCGRTIGRIPTLR